MKSTPHQPSFPYPYLQNSIDVTEQPNEFRCLVNPRDTIYKYNVEVIENTPDGSSKFIRQSGLQTLETPIVGGNGEESFIETINMTDFINNEIVIIEQDDIGLPWYLYGDLKKTPLVGSVGIKYVDRGGAYHIYTWNGTEFIMGTETITTTYIRTSSTKKYSSDWLSLLSPSSSALTPIDGKYYYVYEREIICKWSADKNRYLIIPPNNLPLYNGSDYAWRIRLYGTNTYDGYVTTSTRGHCVELADTSNLEVGMWVEARRYSDATRKYCYQKRQIIEVLSDKVITQNFDSEFVQEECIVNSATSPLYYFKARNNAVITAEVPETIESTDFKFNATYSQEQDVGIAYYSGRLYVILDGIKHLVDATDEIYSSNIHYEYYGLIDKSNYVFELQVTTDDGNVIVQEYSFDVDNEPYTAITTSEVRIDHKSNSLVLDYSKTSTINGISEIEGYYSLEKYKEKGQSEFPIKNNAVNVGVDNAIFWNQANDKALEIPQTSTTFIHWHKKAIYNGDISKIEDEKNQNNKIVVGSNERGFYYDNQDSERAYIPVLSHESEAIAGQDNYSNVVDGIIDNYNITIPSSSYIPQNNDWVSIQNQQRKTQYIKVASYSNGVITLQSAIKEGYSYNGSVYNKDSIFTIGDEQILTDTDILVDGNSLQNTWWLIAIQPTEEIAVKIYPTQIYEEPQEV